jgi:hypothetical protein
MSCKERKEISEYLQIMSKKRSLLVKRGIFHVILSWYCDEYLNTNDPNMQTLAAAMFFFSISEPSFSENCI